MELIIEFKDKSRIAHEVVFLDEIKRDIANAFRFALKSYLYHKDRALYEFSVYSNMSSNTISRQLGSGRTVNRLINYTTAKAACDFFEIDITWLYSIAEQFVNNKEYNAIGFNDNGHVLFIKAFKFMYSD